MSRLNEKDARKMIDELLNSEEGLSNWDCDFIDSVHNRQCELTPEQKRWIEKIWNRVF